MRIVTPQHALNCSLAHDHQRAGGLTSVCLQGPHCLLAAASCCQCCPTRPLKLRSASVPHAGHVPQELQAAEDLVDVWMPFQRLPTLSVLDAKHLPANAKASQAVTCTIPDEELWACLQLVVYKRFVGLLIVTDADPLKVCIWCACLQSFFQLKPVCKLGTSEVHSLLCYLVHLQAHCVKRCGPKHFRRFDKSLTLRRHCKPLRTSSQLQ